jgi:hypothetical protein
MSLEGLDNDGLDSEGLGGGGAIPEVPTGVLVLVFDLFVLLPVGRTALEAVEEAIEGVGETVVIVSALW